MGERGDGPYFGCQRGLWIGTGACPLCRSVEFRYTAVRVNGSIPGVWKVKANRMIDRAQKCTIVGKYCGEIY